MTDGLSAYRRTAVSTASPTGLITLLLRRCLQELELSSKDLERNAAATEVQVGAVATGVREHLRLAQEILSTLRASLRHDLAEPLPAQLDALYDFVYWRTVESYSSLDPEPCRDAIDALRPILDAWRVAFDE